MTTTTRAHTIDAAMICALIDDETRAICAKDVKGSPAPPLDPEMDT